MKSEPNQSASQRDQHILPDLLVKPGEELARILGQPLSDDTLVSKQYHGPARVMVPTVPSSAAAGESLTLKIIILAETAPRQAMLQWRPLGPGEFTRLPLKHTARGVYYVQIPAEAAQGTAFEYCVNVIAAGGQSLFFPATAPALDETVVVRP